MTPTTSHVRAAMCSLGAMMLLAFPSLTQADVLEHTFSGQAHDNTYVTTTSSADTYNHDVDYVWMRHIPGQSWAYVQWTLEHPQDTPITSVDAATFTIVHAGNKSAVGNVYRVYRLTESFDETQVAANQITGNNSFAGEVLAIDTDAYVDVEVTRNDAHTIDINVADLLSNNGDLPTFGLRVELITAGDDYTSGQSVFAQRHITNYNKQAYNLNATYTTVPEPGALGLSLGGAALMSVRRPARD